MNSANSAGEIDIHPLNEEIVRQVNKNFMYYYFCIDIKDYAFQRIDNKGNATYVVLPKFLCIKTFVPLGSFYEKLMLDIAEYVRNQRSLEVKKEKPITDKTLNVITNMRFEFEDYRIENKGTLPSRLMLDLFEQKLDNRLPKQLSLQSSQLTIQYNVAFCDASYLPTVSSGRWKVSTEHHK